MKCLHFLMIIMDSFLGQHNPLKYFALTLQSKDELKELVDKKGGKHAFIVSPSRQNIPKGSNTKERQLWKKLILIGNEKGKQISDIVHYVKVTPSDKYSNHNQIICSAKSPIEIPFSN